MEQVTIFDKILYIKNQLIVLFITTSLVAGLVVVRYLDFFAREESPQILQVTPAKLAEWKADPSVVSVGLYIFNFTEFNMRDNDFVIDAVVWFEYDTNAISTEMIGKFSFENAEILQMSPPDTKTIKDKLFSLYKVKVKFSSNIDYTEFPMDDHKIYISILNKFVNPQDIIFYSDFHNFIFSDDVYLVEWAIRDSFVEYGHSEADLERFEDEKVFRDPKVVFSFEVRRTGFRKILLVLIPLFLIFFIGLFSFGFSPATHTSQIQYVAAGAVTSLIAYRFVLQSLSPPVGYFMFVDYIFTVFLIFSFIVFFMGLYVIYYGKLTRRMQMIRAILLISFHITIVILCYYLLFVWGRL